MLSAQELATALNISNVRMKQILKDRNLDFLRKRENGKIFVPHSTVGILLKEKGQEIKPEILSNFILKGGTGKSVLNVNYSCWLAERSLNPILLIDLDGEACASNMLLKEQENLDNLVTIYEILKNNLQIKDYVRETKYPNLFILPARMKALKSERLAGGRNPKTLLRKHMKGLAQRFGSIIFDMPPTLNSLTVSALLTISKLVIPINSDIFSIESLYLTLDELKEYAEEYECSIPEYYILMNKFQSNTIASSEAYKEITKNFGDRLIPTQLKFSAQINNSVNNGKTIREGCARELRASFDEVASYITGTKNNQELAQ
ncbi:MAG: ParA family protein [Bdellovibrionales bacterium]|nr:ParA family protein [Bdellovibrionales bacterium]